ncbi:pheromone and odorant receptor-like protein [Sarcoptes scabiei]|uniref:Pheromone and odorant receptor-like protein n=1 Tax=Sarcoptes scabiei TaxID=52283 RepID=A0A132A401_SARSC|nr:pheromone and odorant receptor-like protein [Sarcoptes scabiei]
MIATQDISFIDLNFGPKYGILQTATNGQSLIRAAIEQLKYFGWRYVTIVVDHNDLLSTTMFHQFQELALQEKICFVSIEFSSTDHNQTLTRIIEHYRIGSNVIVLLTNYINTINFMTYYRAFNKFSGVFDGNLHFMIVRDQNLETVYGYEEEYLGSIFVRESIGNINHFDNFFLDLVSNPKADKFLHSFIQQCGMNSAQCLRTIGSFDKAITTNTMQAILAIVGGFARMRNQTCAQEKGICNEMLYSDFNKNLLKYILNTRSIRIDSEIDKKFKSDHYDIFEFAADGSSARDIEILNFKHDHSNGLFRFDNVAIYNHNREKLIKNPNVRYIFYKFNGFIDGHKEYNETEFISSDCVDMKKCSQCEPQTPEFIYMPSWDDLIISGIFDVHQHSTQNPFICERNETIFESVQNVEAFIWAIDLINNNANILPGVHLGSLIFDTCSSYQKIYRDVSNFLSNSLLLGDYKVQIPNSESLAAVVVDSAATKVVDSVLDLTKPLNVSVMSTEAKEIKYNDQRHYPQFLGFSLPNNIYVDSVVSLLKKYSWTFVSVVYENQNQKTHRYVDAFSYFQHIAQQNSIKIATKELYNEKNLMNIVKNLNSFAKIGSKVIIIFLSPENLNSFLAFDSKIPNTSERLQSSDVIFLTIGNKNLFTRNPSSSQAINVISFNQDEHLIEEFREHFNEISPQKSLKNPWFQQYWDRLNPCKGFNCNRIGLSLGQLNVTIDARTTTIIHSVLGLAHGLEFLRQKLCPQTLQGLCKEFHQHLRQDSRLVYDYLKENGFIGLDGKQYQFSSKSNYLMGEVFVENFHAQSSEWFEIGKYSYRDGFTSRSDQSAFAKFYLPNGTTISYPSLISSCNDASQCEALKEYQEINQTLPLLLDENASSVAIVAIMLPLHEIERNLNGQIDCGHINPELFEKLLALFFAMDRIDRQQSTPLNLLVLDVCILTEQKLIRTISDYNLDQKITAFLSFEDHKGSQTFRQSRKYFLNLLGDHSPFEYAFQRPSSSLSFSSLSTSINDRNDFVLNEKIDFIDRKNHQMLSSRSIIDLCKRMHWSSVNLIYSNEFNKNYFIFEANKNNICVDRTLRMSFEDLNRANFVTEWTQNLHPIDTSILVVLVDSIEIVEFLLENASKNLLENFIWIGDQNLKHSMTSMQKKYKINLRYGVVVRRFNKESFLDRQEPSTLMDEFAHYYEVNNQRVSHKILNQWLHEYWKRKFHCSIYTQKFDPKCFDGRYATKTLINAKEMSKIIDFGRTISDAITKFLSNDCKDFGEEFSSHSDHRRNQTSSFDDIESFAKDSLATSTGICLSNFNFRNKLKTFITNELIDKNLLNVNDYGQPNDNIMANGNHGGGGDEYEIEIITDFGKKINILDSLNWKNVSYIVPSIESLQTECRLNCHFCLAQLSQSKNKTINMLFSDSLQSSLISENEIYRNWHIVLSILSTLGIIIVLICVLYCLLVFPVALGTTIIGYQILLGLLFCFLINFAFLMPANHTMCWIRQFGLPFSYCIIISGFFVKSYNYWCQTSMKKSNKTLKYFTAFTQLSVSLVFIIIQLLMTLITMHNLNDGLSFNYDLISPKCLFIDPNRFVLTQMQFILPLILMIFLFVFILFFTIKTFQNEESRWILVCSLLTALFWTVWLASFSLRTLNFVIVSE